MASIEKKRKFRFYISISGIVGLFIIAGVRLFDIQIVDHEKYIALAKVQQNQDEIIPASRGVIYDRNLVPIVSNSMFVSFGAHPKVVGAQAKKYSKTFAEILSEPQSKYLNLLKSKKSFVWLKRGVHPDVAEKINSKKLNGIISIQEPKRLYHLEEIGGQIIGTVNIDNKGIAGIESKFNNFLQGKDGKIIMERDALGNQRPSADHPRIDPKNGNSVYLTIDQEYQTIVFNELKQSVDKMKADKGHAILMNPKTGAVLALVNYPSLKPSEKYSTQIEQYKIPAISDSFEPGSVFKLITAAAAIENNLVELNEKFFAENGEWKIPLSKDKVRTIKDTHPHGEITFQEAMESSSNIVMAKISNRIGADKFYLTARNFGYGMSTGIELGGEINGELKKPFQWSQTTLNTMSFGYEVGATPMQIIQSYAAVANNGVLMKPYLVEKITNEKDEIIFENSPLKVRRVVSERTARILKNVFVGIVERGTGSEAKIVGVPVAGKTGTSKKFINGKYQEGVYNASFVGFYPADNPEIVCLVIIENPKIGSYYGGQTSAPIFKAVAERIVYNKGMINKKVAEENGFFVESTKKFVPDVQQIKIESAIKILEKEQIKYSIIGNGDFVFQQHPLSGGNVNLDTEIKLITVNSQNEKNKSINIPNLRGLSLRKAINRLTIENCDVEIIGNGLVVGQIETVNQKNKKKVTLICDVKSMENKGIKL